jgi:hypothetical protein
MIQAFGQAITITDAIECARGGDHRKLIADARVDYLNRAIHPDDKFVMCGRCVKAISLKI